MNFQQYTFDNSDYENHIYYSKQDFNYSKTKLSFIFLSNYSLFVNFK